MKTIRIFNVFILIIIGLFGFGQTDTIVWQQCLGTDESDYPATIAKVHDGFMVGIGIKKNEPYISNYHGKVDAWIIKYDSIGNIIWERCYGGSESDLPFKIIPINDSSIYLLNSSNSTDGDVQSENYGFTDLWVVKIKETGEILWERCYGGLNADEDRDALLTKDGGLLLMGRISAAGGNISHHYGLGDVWICKLDSTGDIQWETTLGNQGNDNAIKMKLASDSSFIVLAGFSQDGGMVECENMGGFYMDIWMVEMLISDGSIINQQCYGGTRTDLGKDLIILENGYVFTATTSSNDGDVSGNHGSDDIWVVRLDSGGNIRWQRCLGGTSIDYPQYIDQTEDGGFIVFGNTYSQNGDVSNNNSYPGLPDIWVVKISSIGELEWEHCYGSIHCEWLFYRHAVIKKDEYNYLLLAKIEFSTGDIQCDFHGYYNYDGWLFEIKDCSLYMPATPNRPTGPDTLCTTTDSTSIYSITPANLAHAYEWSLLPEGAGTILGDGTEAKVSWTANWEGEVVIKVRSMNDCGYSGWSEEYHTWAFNCLGIGENDHLNSKIKVYPNPGKDFIIIEWPEELSIHEIHFYDTYGRVMETVQPARENTRYTWQCASFPKGLYFVGVQTDEGRIGRRVVKLSE